MLEGRDHPVNMRYVELTQGQVPQGRFQVQAHGALVALQRARAQVRAVREPEAEELRHG